MAHLSTSTPPIAERDPAERERELRADLAALVEARGAPPDRFAVQARPSVLRRLASVLGARVGPDIDRLVGVADDTALVVAVSLYTGVPMAVVATNTSEVRGELHAAERVLEVSYTASDGDLAPVISAVGATVVSRVSVFGAPGIGDALFDPVRLSDVSVPDEH